MKSIIKNNNNKYKYKYKYKYVSLEEEFKNYSGKYNHIINSLAPLTKNKGFNSIEEEVLYFFVQIYLDFYKNKGPGTYENNSYAVKLIKSNFEQYSPYLKYSTQILGFWEIYDTLCNPYPNMVYGMNHIILGIEDLLDGIVKWYNLSLYS